MITKDSKTCVNAGNGQDFYANVIQAFTYVSLDLGYQPEFSNTQRYSLARRFASYDKKSHRRCTRPGLKMEVGS